MILHQRDGSCLTLSAKLGIGVSVDKKVSRATDRGVNKMSRKQWDARNVLQREIKAITLPISLPQSGHESRL